MGSRVDFNPFRPIENPRVWKECTPAERWLRGTGNRHPEDLSDMVTNRYKKNLHKHGQGL